MPAVDLTPSLANVRAILTTKWGNSGYRPRVINSIESYYVDTALDNDSDVWTMDIGDPHGELLDTLQRDSEVRAQLFGVGPNRGYLVTGISDELTYGDDGILTITGRDYSSLAVDSFVEPKQFRHVRAWAVVADQARALGFQRTKLTHGNMVKKVQYTDGSESYWEFWYRLYRKEKMWIWCEPDGTLIASGLNYGSNPIYFFGIPKTDDSAAIKKQYIPVEQISIRKATQARVAEVWVFGHKGDNGFLSISKDPTMNGWIKRPRKIMLDTESHTAKGAQTTGWEEIFEGKVGEIEVTVTIADPGFVIRQNEVARIRVPQIGLVGDYYVVGNRIQGGANGFVQEVRLRERQYATSRRVPADPASKSQNAPSVTSVEASLSENIGAFSNAPQEWGAFFVKAAKDWHGPWDYNLFLATLIGIADHETGGAFLNERQNGGPGGDHVSWYPKPATASKISAASGSHGKDTVPTQAELERWHELFANEKDDGYVKVEYGVGTMQLTDRGLKHEADDRFKLGFRDEFEGGRWVPEHNIYIGGKYLRSCLQSTVRDSGRDIDIWMGVSAYNKGPNGAYVGDPYALAVKNLVYNTPGYLGQVKSTRDAAIALAKQEAAANGPETFNPTDTGYENAPDTLLKLTNIKRLDSKVDLLHVDFLLLDSLNRLGVNLGHTITITSGFRTYQKQKELWDTYRRSGFNIKYIAANPDKNGPDTSPGNHQLGLAVDATINGVAIGTYVPAFQLAVFGLNCTVAGDPVHVTRVGVNG